MELAHWLGALRYRARLFVAVLGVTLALGLLVGALKDPVYEASADVQLSQPEGAALLLGATPAAPDLDAELRTAESQSVLDAAAERGETGEFTVVADAERASLVFTGTGSTPGAAAASANVHAAAYVEVRNQQVRAQTREAIDRLAERADELEEEVNGLTSTTSTERAAALRAQRATYREAADQLEVSLLIGATAGARVSAQAEVPEETSPVSRVITALVLALLGGLLLAAGAVGVVEFLDRSVKDPDAAGDAAGGVPVLGQVGPSRGVRVTGSGVKVGGPVTGAVLVDAPESVAAEDYRRLRATVRASVDAPNPLVHVTSCRYDDGAALVAVNLAVAFAETGMPTVLVCLRQPDGVLLDVEEATGREPLAALVTAGAPADSYLARVADVEDLSVVVRPVDGRTGRRSDPAAIADSLKQLDVISDAIVLLSPPVLATATALDLAGVADGTLLVARQRTTVLSDVEQAAQELAGVDAELLGVVLA